MRVVLVLLVALFTASQVFARSQKPFVMKGKLGLYTSGQDCGKVLSSAGNPPRYYSRAHSSGSQTILTLLVSDGIAFVLRVRMLPLIL